METIETIETMETNKVFELVDFLSAEKIIKEEKKEEVKKD